MQFLGNRYTLKSFKLSIREDFIFVSCFNLHVYRNYILRLGLIIWGTLPMWNITAWAFLWQQKGELHGCSHSFLLYTGSCSFLKSPPLNSIGLSGTAPTDINAVALSFQFNPVPHPRWKEAIRSVDMVFPRNALAIGVFPSWHVSPDRSPCTWRCAGGSCTVFQTFLAAAATLWGHKQLGSS